MAEETGRVAAEGKRPALFEFAPTLVGRVPWLPLGRFPTPLERVRLGAREILVKREDLSAQPYGGNKVRKLEFLLAAARTEGATRLITVGAAGSHHALATTVYGRALGFEVTLVLFPQRRTAHVRHVLRLDAALGAELRFTGRMTRVPLALARARMAHRGERCRVIPPGGSDALGTLGWVSAGLELAKQLREPGIDRPAVIHVATGTMGTVAGLALGLAMAETPVPIAASRITARIVTNARVLAKLLDGAAAILRSSGVPAPVEAATAMIELRDDQLGAGYGQTTPAADAATEVFAAAGLTLDPTYTAKAAAALLADPPPAGGPALFLHTLSAAEPAPANLERVRLPAPFERYLERP